jgi:hypothetical protein
VTATLPGVPAGTVARGRQLLSAAREALDEPAATDDEIVDHLTLGQRCGAAAPSAPVDVGGGWVCADLGGEGDAEAFERLLSVLGPGPHDPEDVARRAQEWRLPVTPYRASPRRGRCPGLPAVDRARRLAGTRVVDLTSMWAGPLATHLLAAAGADVDTVEAACRPDGLRGTPAMFEVLAAGKRRHDLDLRQDEARQAFLDLVADADVVIESFSPRVLPNLGLDLPTLRTANPDVLLVSMPAFAADSAERDWVAYGTGVHAACGLGVDDGGRAWAPAVTYPDPLGGLAAFAAICTALAMGLRGRHLVVPLEAALAGLGR